MRRLALILAAALALLGVSAAPAQADHGHNCIYTGGGWVGQGLCPGMPGYVPHTDPPEPEPTATATATPTVQPTTPAPTATTSMPAPTRTTTPPLPAPAPTRTPGCLRSYGNEWCTGQTPAPVPSATTPAPAVTGPLVDTDIIAPAWHWISLYVY